jgi:glucokinase
MDKKYIISIDLGGTNTRIALLDYKLKIIARTSFATEYFISQKQELIREIINKIRELIKGSHVEIKYVLGLGIGVPGPVNFSKGIVHYLPNIPHWENTPIKNILERRTKFKVFVDNDVNLMTLAESRLGAARNQENAVCITLGTGVGGGLILEGNLFRGADFCAGEVGHMPISINGSKCNCGGKGCLETYVGNKVILSKARNLFGRKDIALTELSTLARKGNKKALGIFNDFAEKIGIALTGVVNLLNPRVIVIGGGLSFAGSFLFKKIKDTINKRAMPIQAKYVKIKKASLGKDSGLIGAALLVKENYNQHKCLS